MGPKQNDIGGAGIEHTHPGTVLGVMPAGGGEFTPLVDAPLENWCNSWSPDDDKIAYAALRDGVWNLYWVSRSTRREQPLTDHKLFRTYVRYPEWSPKGDQIVYEFAGTKGNLFVAELR
jgi:Tol biopolymer transport system component